MIPETFIESWRSEVKWQTLAMVEQDLVISRALICLYNDPVVKESLIFRGGTALNKLFIRPAARYSEDIDFVQRKSEPIGPAIDAIRAALKSWLGEPKRKITERGAKLIYLYQAVNGLPVKLKIEINTTEHFQVLPFRVESFSIQSPWFSGQCEIITYELDELIATKFRALYQRRKGRDLFDLWHVFQNGLINTDRVIAIFKKYCANDGLIITRDLFEENIKAKRVNKDFQVDMSVLLPPNVHWDFDEALDMVQKNFIIKI